MTSVGAISSAVARIECLKDLHSRLPNEANELLEGLKGIKELLVAVCDREAETGPEFDELEIQAVRLSYEIGDATADASFSVKKSNPRRKSGNTSFRELQQQLNYFRDELKKTASPGSGMPGEKNASTSSEIQRENEQNPGTFTVNPGSEAQGEKKLGPKQKSSKKSLSSKVIQLWKNLDAKVNGPTEEVKKKDPGSTPASPGSEIHGGTDRNPRGSEIQQEQKAGSCEDLLDRMREDLLNPSSGYLQMYIAGEHGMGKSTLARKLFLDPQLRASFNVFAWVPINQNFQIKRVLQVLVQQLGPRKQLLEIREMNEIQLIAQIFDQLKNKTYLIVLDDVGAMGHWESIRLALPLANSNRVIITTSSHDFDREAQLYNISGLTLPQILRLLEVEASFGPGLEKVGEAIYDISNGSPLFATILGKSLQAKAASENKQQLVDELHHYMPYKGTARILGACYKSLAPELKTCLLYMGLFPQGHDIEVDKLYLLLVAENLLSPKESKITPQTFKKYLDKLAGLKFVGVQEDIVSPSGLYKFCRLHELVWSFCRWKGSDEEFFVIVDLQSSTEVGSHTRRLAINLRGDNSNQLKIQDTVDKIWSLLIFETFGSVEEKPEWPSEISDLAKLIYLSVINFDRVNFNVRKLPGGLGSLVLLKYLSFRGCWLKELPSSISNLTQLETLDLLVQAECEMFIPSSTFTNMRRMAHLYLPRLYRSNGRSKLQLQGMERLEILVNFDTEIFDVRALSHLKNLKILSTISRGDSKDFDAVINSMSEKIEGLQHSSVVITRFDCYNKDSVSALGKLLQFQFVHSIHIEGQIGKLPEEGPCGERVAEIVLDGSELELDPIIYFGKFQNLRSLVLSNDAFLGKEILISAALPFGNLRSLKLQSLKYLEKLSIERNTLPELSSLQIDNCGCLKKLSIPAELDDRLTKAQGENGHDAYLVVPWPSKFVKTT